jgi:hypothetical protein
MSLSDSQLRCLEQLAETREIPACRNCGSERVRVDEYASNWSSGGAFRVILECADCGEGGADFHISGEEARGCGIYPDENPPISETI